ncbi:MAG: hypothetical protein R2867_30875 [Caldilineaceae bacterium]
MATAPSVTPAQAASASSEQHVTEQLGEPLPPVADAARLHQRPPRVGATTDTLAQLSFPL